MLAKFIFSESITVVDDYALDDSDIRTLERMLRKRFGYKSKQLNAASQSMSYDEYVAWLVDEVKKNTKQSSIGDVFEKPSGGEELDDEMAAGEPEEKLRDESVVDALKYLVRYWSRKKNGKDKVRAVAARFKIDPDIYAAAGLGNIPEDYSDEDIWQTMDMSGQGKHPFYESVWQPLYIDAMQDLAELPEEIKDELKVLVQKETERKREVRYPTRSDDQYTDSGMAYEAKLAESVVIEGDDGMLEIPEGAKIRVLKK